VAKDVPGVACGKVISAGIDPDTGDTTGIWRVVQLKVNVFNDIE